MSLAVEDALAFLPPILLPAPTPQCSSFSRAVPFSNTLWPPGFWMDFGQESLFDQ